MRRSVLLLLLGACAGPSAHLQRAASSALAETTEPVRPSVSSMLDANDPLDARACSSSSGVIEACSQPTAAPAAHHHHAAAPDPLVDPTCGMTVKPPTAHSVMVDGHTVSFCSLSCKQAYLSKHGDGGTP